MVDQAVSSTAAFVREVLDRAIACDNTPPACRAMSGRNLKITSMNVAFKEGPEHIVVCFKGEGSRPSSGAIGSTVPHSERTAGTILKDPGPSLKLRLQNGSIHSAREK